MLVSTLLRWDPATISCAVARFAAIAQDLWSTQYRLNGHVGSAVFVDTHWEGAARGAAERTFQERAQSLSLLTGALDAAQIAARNFATAIEAAQRDLRSALTAASGTFLVSDYGYVSLAPPPPAPVAATAPSMPRPMPTPMPTSLPTPVRRSALGSPRVPSPSPGPADALAAQLGSLSGRIGGALGAAEAADLTCADALHAVQESVDHYLRLHAHQALRSAEAQSMPPLELLAWLMTVPPPGTSAEDVATWWAAQDTPSQEALVQAHPDELGNLDGVPPAVRDTANRLALTRHIAELRVALTNPAAHVDDVLDTLVQLRWYETVRAQLDGYAARPDPRTGIAVHIQLLMLDQRAFDGVGRAAMAFGDVGTAANVSYLIPGLNQKVDPDLGRTVSNAWNLYSDTGTFATSQTGAVVAWLGYETPGFSNVAWDNCAEHGAERLRDELAGLLAVRGDDQPHLTVVGHSYGSTTAALAAHRYDLGVDDLVLVGSPGATVDSASALHVPAGHVWDGAASGDMVSWLRWFGNVDPATAEFGAVRFQAETAGRSGDGTRNSGEHSHYFDVGSESLDNISNVVVRRADAVLPAQYREDDLVMVAYGGAVFTSGAEDDPEVDRPVRTTR
ncbi:MAG: hypothetical protein JWM93_1028 [Frankiales bacterium]|nr:hypothetical protein [Frankiales bacterium]